MVNELILTYDLGTTGSKCTVFDETGLERMSCVVPYDTIYPQPGWAEQDMLLLLQSIKTGTGELINIHGLNPSDIAVIGLSGQMNGCIPVDGHGEPLHNNIIHSDCRTWSQCETIQAQIGFDSFFRMTGNRPDPHYTLPKILWLKAHYPDIYNKTAYFVNAKDYISSKLTGRPGITDYSDASLTCMLDLSRKDWAYDMLKTLGVNTSKLPELKSSFDLAGYLTDEAAELIGLPSGIPVSVGGGDGACAARGAGLRKTGDTYNYIGSSSWIGSLSDAPVLDKAGRIFSYYDLDGKHFDVCGTVQCAAAAFNWAADMFIRSTFAKEPEDSFCREDVSDVYRVAEELAESSPAGSNGLIFVPYLMGERTPHWDPSARGAFIGLTLYHSRGDMLRSVYEGVSFALMSVLQALKENLMEIGGLTLIGGCAKSRLWNEILSSIYNKPVAVHKYPGSATSLGAAIAAGISVGIFKGFDSVPGPAIDRIYTPDESMHTEYYKYYKIFESAYSRLKPFYDDFAKLGIN